MGQEHLFNQEAIDKIKTIADKIDLGMLCTHDENNDIHAIPMSWQEVDEAGNIWYLFSSESHTYKNLQRRPEAYLMYADPGSYTFLTVKGETEISHDKARIEKYWNKFVEVWFEKGKDDPAIRILKFNPNDAHYWDNDSNKLVTFLKVAASAVTGSKLDIGREGSLNL